VSQVAGAKWGVASCFGGEGRKTKQHQTLMERRGIVSREGNRLYDVLARKGEKV